MSHLPSVLLCDSEPQSIRALKAVLRAAGVRVYAMQTAEEALTRAALDVPDVAIIELELVDSSGAEVCRRLREWSSMPLIVVSRVSDEDRIVDAFTAGADDYITKPFMPREFVARLQAHLRRAITLDEPVIMCDDVLVDLAARVVRREGREIRLTPIENRLLSALVRNRGRLLAHDALLREVWGAARTEDGRRSGRIWRTFVASLPPQARAARFTPTPALATCSSTTSRGLRQSGRRREPPPACSAPPNQRNPMIYSAYTGRRWPKRRVRLARPAAAAQSWRRSDLNQPSFPQPCRATARSGAPTLAAPPTRSCRCRRVCSISPGPVTNGHLASRDGWELMMPTSPGAAMTGVPSYTMPHPLEV